MNRSIFLAWAALLTACATTPLPSSDVQGLAEARRLLSLDPDSVALEDALTRLDAVAAECREDASYHALRGEITLRLAAKTRDAGGSGAGFLFEDAATELGRAVELDGRPATPRLLLAQALYDTNQLEPAATMAATLLQDRESQDAKPEERAAAHALVAQAAGRAYAVKRVDGVEDVALLAAARSSLRALEQSRRLDPGLLSLWSATEQWAGEPLEAVGVYARAARREPEDHGIASSLVETAAALGRLPQAREVFADRRDATGLWYRGRVQYLLAGVERQEGRASGAQGALDGAMQCFAQSMALNAEYREGCELWIAMCLGKKGNIAFLAGDLEHAEAWLLEATRRRPDRIEEDLGLSETTKLGLLRVGDKYMRNYEKAEAFYRTAAELVGTDLDLLNNAAVFARDRGNQLERAGKTDEAVEMYERSFATYRRAVQLDPRSVRLRNDCALIAVHHLEREWEAARAMLDSAILDGERSLLDDPPSDARELEDLDEAVGDCYENLALWHLKQGPDAAAAKAAAAQSLKHHPRERRAGAQRHLKSAERVLSGE